MLWNILTDVFIWFHCLNHVGRGRGVTVLEGGFFFREQSKYTPLVLIVYTVCFRQHSCHVFIVSHLNNFISLSQPHFSVSCCNCMISPFFNWHWTEVFFPHCFRCLDVTRKLYQYWLLEPKHNSIRHCKHTRQHKRKIYRHFKVSNALYCKF